MLEPNIIAHPNGAVKVFANYYAIFSRDPKIANDIKNLKQGKDKLKPIIIGIFHRKLNKGNRDAELR